MKEELIKLREVKVKLIDEQKQLSLNTEKLNLFLYTDEFDLLDREYRHLLIEQYAYMKNYLRVLNKRIALVNADIKNFK